MFPDNLSAQGRQSMQDVASVTKAATASTATGAGIAMWLGANLPLYIQCATAFTLTCTAIVFIHKFARWMRAWLRG